MDEQLDNDLNNRIREVFDNFEDPSYPSADEGWLLLRNKFPEMEKKRPVARLWWASAAAAVLLFVGAGLWLLNKPQQSQTTASAPIKKAQEQATVADSSSLLATKQNSVIKNSSDALITDSSTNNSLPASKIQTGKLAAKPVIPAIANGNNPAYANTITKPVQQPLTKAAPDTNNSKPNPAQYAANSTTPVAAGSKASIGMPVIPAKSTNGVQQPAPVVNAPQYAVVSPVTNASKSVVASTSANNNTAPVSSITQQAKGPTQPKANSMEALFASESKTPKPDEKYTDDKKVRFGVYAATFFNYSKGSSNQVNAGVGFSSDIKLSKNIKLSTGLALAQNTLSYNSNTAPLNYASAAAKPQALAGSYDKENLFSANAAFPVLKNYNANLVGLDIPLNLKYEFNPQKNDTYISAGLSSGTFINEAYTSVYGYTPSSIAAGASQQTTDETTRKNFNGFYFAKTLNVSFGVGYPIGKNNRIIIEPFLKYPLDGLGSQQLRFGAGGLNLKLNFTSPKK